MTTLNSIGTPAITLGGTLTLSGAFATTITVTAGTSVTLPTTGTLVNSAVTTLSSLVSVGTIGAGTWQGTAVAGQYGGTGVANTGLTITLAGGSSGKLLTSDSSGNATWASPAATSISITGDSGGALTGSAFTLTGASTGLTFTGSSTTETLGGILVGTNGGTGVNNGASTITIGGNVAFSGSFTFAGTVTGNTTVTFPTSGTLVETGVATLSSLASVGTITTGTWSAILKNYIETNNIDSQASAYVINLANGNVHSLTMTGSVSLTFSNVPAGTNCCSITLFLIQGGSGSNIPSFPGSVVWAGGTPPTFTTTVGHVDQVIMTTVDAGTTWRAASILDYAS